MDEPVKQPVKQKKDFIMPKLKAGSKISVRFYNTAQGAKPYTEDARKRKVGKKKEWYEGEVKKIDKKEHEWSVYFDSDHETAILNLSNPDDEDFLKEGHGWKA